MRLDLHEQTICAYMQCEVHKKHTSWISFPHYFSLGTSKAWPEWDRCHCADKSAWTHHIRHADML